MHGPNIIGVEASVNVIPVGGPSRARRERGGARPLGSPPPLPPGSCISVSLSVHSCCSCLIRWLCELLLSRLCRRRNRTITHPAHRLELDVGTLHPAGGSAPPSPWLPAPGRTQPEQPMREED